MEQHRELARTQNAELLQTLEFKYRGLRPNLLFSTGIPVCILVLKKCKKPDDNKANMIATGVELILAFALIFKSRAIASALLRCARYTD